ncbi:hypothetical protein [Bosea thiooxidans]
MVESFGNGADGTGEDDLDARFGKTARALDGDLGGATVDRAEIADDHCAHEGLPAGDCPPKIEEALTPPS